MSEQVYNAPTTTYLDKEGTLLEYVTTLHLK